MLLHWASSFCFSFASPYMIANVGANTFLIFMGFDVLATVFCLFFVRETRGKNLERAAGTEWEVAAEKDEAALTEQGESAGRTPSVLGDAATGGGGGHHHAHVLHGKDGALVDDVTGQKLNVVSVHDNFKVGSKRKNKAAE